MKASVLVLLLAIGAQSTEASVLQFSARIQKESLAEDAIDLLHCLAERSGESWELGEDARAEHSLYLEEKAGALEGVYKNYFGPRPVRLKPGGAQKVCDELAAPKADEETGPLESTAAPESSPKISRWIWAAAAVVTIAGGVIWWKSRAQGHRALRME